MTSSFCLTDLFSTVPRGGTWSSDRESLGIMVIMNHVLFLSSTKCWNTEGNSKQRCQPRQSLTGPPLLWIQWLTPGGKDATSFTPPHPHWTSFFRDPSSDRWVYTVVSVLLWVYNVVIGVHVWQWWVYTLVSVLVWQGSYRARTVSCGETVGVLARLLCAESQRRSRNRYLTYLILWTLVLRG